MNAGLIIADTKKFLNFKNPLTRFFIYLLGFAFISSWDLFVFAKPTQAQQYGLNAIVVAITAFVLFYVTRYKFNVKQANPLNIWISCIIVYLLIHPTNPIWMFILALIFVWLGKQYLQYKKLPVFNPAALGLFAAYYVTSILENLGLINDSLLVSWWGADMQQNFLRDTSVINIIVAVVLLFGFGYFVNAFKKNLYVASFFMSAMAAVFFYHMAIGEEAVKSLEFLSSSLFNSFAFMLLVMIAEPKTSPNFLQQQGVIGPTGGAVFFFLNTYIPETYGATVGLPFITTVLIMNLMVFGAKKMQFSKQVATTSAGSSS